MSPSSSRRALVAALFAILALVACGSAGPRAVGPPQSGSGRAECGGPPLEDVTADQASPVALLDAIGTARAPVTYVFVVDASRSMRDDDRYGEVRRQLRVFLGALCPDDQVAGVTFADRADAAMSLRPVRDAADLPDQLPPPDGRNTDIGAGLARALDEVDAAPPGRQTAVILLSDGDHQPPDGSDYPEDTGDAWSALRERAEAAGERRSLQAYSIPLVGSSGADLLASVFPQARNLVAEGPGPLAEVLGRVQQQTRLDQAAPLLRSEEGTGVTVEWPDLSDTALDRGEVRADLRLHNTSAVFPVTLDGASITSSGDVDVISDPLPGSISLAAGETRLLPVLLRWTEPRRAGPIPGEGTYSSELTLAATVTSHTAEGLARLLDETVSPTDPDVQGADATLSGRAPVAFSVWWWLALAAVVGVALVLWRRVRPALPGQLGLYGEEPDENRPPPLLGTVRLDGHRSARAHSDDGTGLLEVPGFDVRVRVRGHRGLLGGAPVARITITMTPRWNPAEPTRSGRLDVPLDDRRLVVGLDVHHESTSPTPRAYPATGVPVA